MTTCMEWPRPRNRYGYGIIWHSGKNYVLAHRMAWIMEHGSIPEGMFICHSCDNRACINVDHMFLGFPSANSKDMVNKGRQMHGEKHYKSKLTEEQVLEIRADVRSSRQVAETYNLSKTNVLDIRNKKIWRHL